MKPQKALHLHIEEDKKNPKFKGRMYAIMQKFDGWYGYLEEGKIYSRAGRLIPSLAHLAMPKLKGRLIFEILVEGVPVFSDLNGILNRKAPCNDAYFKVHDWVLHEEATFSTRWATACDFCYRYGEEYKMSIVKLLGQSKNPQVWKDTAKKLWDLDKEGVILKAMDAPYSSGKRNADVMKIKEEVTLDLLVIGLEMGKGKYHSNLGALIVKDKANNTHSISGMTDAQRKMWWNAPKCTFKVPHPILGRVVEVKAMKILKDGSLREPRFKAIRYDKTKTEID